MADRLVPYLAKSVAKWLDDNVGALDKAYVTTPDFNFDRKPNPSNPSQTVARALPYATVGLLTDASGPFTMGNILFEADIVFNIGVYGTGYSNLVELTSDLKQSLKGAAHPVSSEVGIPLYDFAVVSGSFFDLVGAVEIFDFGETTYFGPQDGDQQDNAKHRSLTPIMLSAYKDKDANLLENLGNVNIND